MTGEEVSVTDLARRAEVFARRAHAGQVDKQGRDYADHHLAPIAALLAPFGEEAVAAGWLHDVMEDCGVGYADLIASGFPRAVADAVDSVSRRGRDEPYDRLVERAARHPLGRYVKLMDNWWNLSGLDGVQDEATRERLRAKYVQARMVLLRACGLAVG